MKHGNLAIFVPHIGCPHRCSFCDQRAISGENISPTPADVAELCRAGIEKNRGRSLELAFFGGSFTAIPRDYMVSLLEAVQPFLGMGIDGIRISTRPDAVGEEILRLLHRYGVTAIELGAQSMDDTVLTRSQRGHTAADVVAASERIRAAGFSLGLQMMLGLEGETSDSVLETVARLMTCRPDTVRIYPALVLKNTPLAARMAAGAYTPLSLSEAVARTAGVMELFAMDANIRIIRVGLHAAESLEKNLLAGPYHPAFRELCEGEICRRRLEAQLTGLPTGEVRVRIAPTDLSRLIGQHRCNMTYFSERGYRIFPHPVAGQPPLSPEIEPTA